MSLITEAFGSVALELSKVQIIKLLTASPLIPKEERDKYLHDWSAATGIPVEAVDFAALETEE